MGQKRLKTLSKAMAALLIVALLAPGAAAPAHAAPGDITRVSVSSSEAQANSYSRDADISDDGRFVAFWSGADNLVAEDTNEFEDIFLRDVQAGETTRVSVNSAGAQANQSSYYPSISGDGRFVAFMSDATNLVSGDTNGVADIFVHDRQVGATTRVSISSSGTQADQPSDSYVAISTNGRYIAFASEATNLVSEDTNGDADVFVHDRQTGTTERISLDSSEVQGNGSSGNPSLSADGRFVAFTSSATNLVGGDTNSQIDVFVRDRAIGVTTRVSVNSSGVQADRGGRDPAISADGRYVAFASLATNLFNEEPFGYPHIFVHDRQTGATTLVTVNSDGWQMVGTASSPDISADGRYITYDFDDRADGLGFWEIYLHDRLTRTNTGISGPGGSEEDSSFSPAISSNGDYVAFTSFNKHLVPDDTNEWNDVFRRELAVPVPATQAYQSIGTHDGWVIESGEDSNEGTRIDSGASTLFLGDANNDQQYRSILHFTTASLPNNAIITNVTLRVKRQSITGTNPFTTHGNLLVDIRKPYFGSAVDVQAVDFQAPADLQGAGILESAPGALWYTADLDPGSFPFVDRTGTTQFRLRFALDDDNDDEQDIIKFYSGDAASADQPVLTIDYFLPAGGSPSVTGIFRADANPTTAPTVRFTVAFSEAVTGVDVSDLRLATSGTISGASINSVSGSGDAYTVTVGTGTGNGTLRLDLIDDNSILDANNIPLAGSGTENGSFYAGESYTVTKTIFGDVPESHWAWSFIERLYKAGITGGCGIDPLMYCPEGTVTRAQMAVFLERGIHGSTYNPPSVGASTGFSDVPLTYWAASWIKQLAAEGITGGCGAGTYCPESAVTRAQMAIFLLRSRHGSGYNPPSVGGSTGFSDVPADHWAAAWIKQLVAEGIATGCMTGAYCPEVPVTRAQMAVFLVRTFSLP